MQTQALEIDSKGFATLRVPGRLDVEGAETLFRNAQDWLSSPGMRSLRIDLSELRVMDSAGALAVHTLREQAESRRIRVSLHGAGEETTRLLSLVQRAASDQGPAPAPRKQPDFIRQIGEASIQCVQDMRFIVGFVGEATIGMGKALAQPRRVRWADTITTMARCGVDAVPIVALISFLIGLIMGFQAAIQLRQFGANIFVANLVGLAQVRELGPLMTAIIVAGRSGSAFAAEIGTMKVSEEVDALSTMGLDVTRFLVVPKVLGLLLVLPVLTLISDGMGILGGLVVGVGGLDLTLTQYMRQTSLAMGVFDVMSGVIKSGVFALLVAGVGCMRGFQVERGAQGVGIATTSSVVSGIFLIILTDALFTILFSLY